MSKIMISELQETTSAPDSSYIAIDNGTTTNKITVANYNANANATAKRYAEASQGYSEDALTAKNDAISAKNEAETLANTASSYANASRASADAAAGSASEASGYVGSAQTSATNALASARAAEASAAEIDEQVKLAKSWAVGNTGVRADEAVNNSMYWAGQAAAAAGGGVVSFNGRTGTVLPNAGDYSSDQIAHVNSDSTYTNVEEALNDLQISRIKNYSSDSTQWDTTPTANSTKPVTSNGILAAITDAINSIPKSYVGMIIHSTKFDTEAKVKGFYGGTKWIRHSGYVLRGATSGVVANSATKTGGNDNAVVVKHTHTQQPHWHTPANGTNFAVYGAGGISQFRYIGSEDNNGNFTGATNTVTAINNETGEDGTNKNIPNYKSVYIWERTQ